MNANTKQFASARSHLSPPEFQLLLSDNDASDEFRVAANHLESCPICQSQLTTLAGSPDTWKEAQLLLGGDYQPRWEPDLSQSLVSTPDSTLDRSSIENHVLKLLGSPNHPEMLGRLGRYDIEKVIGSGGMGIVLKAHDSELNRPIAIKLLAPHLSHVGAAPAFCPRRPSCGSRRPRTRGGDLQRRSRRDVAVFDHAVRAGAVFAGARR